MYTECAKVDYVFSISIFERTRKAKIVIFVVELIAILSILSFNNSYANEFSRVFCCSLVQFAAEVDDTVTLCCVCLLLKLARRG